MKIGLNLLLYTSRFTKKHIKLIDKASKMGFDGVEVPIYDPKVVDVAVIRRALADTGMSCTVCTGLMKGSFVSAAARERQAALDFMRQVLEACKGIGAECLGGPIYSPIGHLVGRGRNAAEWKRAVVCLRKVADMAEELDVKVAIEPINRFETYFCNICADAVKLCREVNSKKIGVLYDTFHANIEEKDPAAALRKIGKGRLFHIHACENDRGIPGSGHVPWNAIMSTLKDMKYDGWLTIESFVPAIKEIAAAAAIWRSLAKDSDDLAKKGLKFLRQYA